MKKLLAFLLTASLALAQTNVQKGAGNVLSNGSIVVGNNTSITTSGNGTIVATGIAPGGIISGANGGTGVANTGKTITIGGNVTTSGAFSLVLTTIGNTTVTLPTGGTLATLDGVETLTNKSISGATNTITGIPISTGLSGFGSGWTTTLAAATGTNGQVLASNGTSYVPTTLAPSTSIFGTANQITASAATGNVTLSLPSSIIAPGTLTLNGTNSITLGGGGAGGASIAATGNLTTSNLVITPPSAGKTNLVGTTIVGSGTTGPTILSGGLTANDLTLGGTNNTTLTIGSADRQMVLSLAGVGSYYFGVNEFKTNGGYVPNIGSSTVPFGSLFLNGTARFGSGTSGPTIAASGTAPNEAMIFTPGGTRGAVFLANGTTEVSGPTATIAKFRAGVNKNLNISGNGSGIQLDTINDGVSAYTTLGIDANVTINSAGAGTLTTTINNAPYSPMVGLVSAKSANFTPSIANAADRGVLYSVTTGVSDITVTMPSAATAGIGYHFTVMKADTGTGRVFFSDATNNSLIVQKDYSTLISDGVNWIRSGTRFDEPRAWSLWFGGGQYAKGYRWYDGGGSANLDTSQSGGQTSGWVFSWSGGAITPLPGDAAANHTIGAAGRRVRGGYFGYDIAANTSADGLVISNDAAATSGNARYSPRLRWRGAGFFTGGAASKTFDVYADLRSNASGTTSTSDVITSWGLYRSVNSGAEENLFHIKSDGPGVAAGTVTLSLGNNSSPLVSSSPYLFQVPTTANSTINMSGMGGSIKLISASFYPNSSGETLGLLANPWTAFLANATVVGTNTIKLGNTAGATIGVSADSSLGTVQITTPTTGTGADSAAAFQVTATKYNRSFYLQNDGQLNTPNGVNSAPGFIINGSTAIGYIANRIWLAANNASIGDVGFDRVSAGVAKISTGNAGGTGDLQLGALTASGNVTLGTTGNVKFGTANADVLLRKDSYQTLGVVLGDAASYANMRVNAVSYSGTLTGLSGGQILTTASKTASYTLTTSDQFISFSGSTASQSLTLPAVAGTTGRIYQIKNRASVTVNVVTTAAANEIFTTAAANTVTLAVGDSAQFISDGTFWNKL